MSDNKPSGEYLNVWESLTIDSKHVTDIAEEPLGSGAYGIVYAAKWHGQDCVVKKMHSVLSKELCKSFFKEAKAMTSLLHRSIASLYGVYYEKGFQYSPILVMEKLWKSLFDFIYKDHCTDVYIVLRILYDVACGLSYLHNNEYIHCDLSPCNVLLTLSCKAKLCDFGQARLCHEHMSTCPGNIAYMPPEALKSKPVYSFKLDVFAFGCLFIFSMTGGKHPSHCDDKFKLEPGGLYHRKLSEAELRSKQIDMIKCFRQRSVIHACLEDDPDQRPESNILPSKLINCMEVYKDCPETMLLDSPTWSIVKHMHRLEKEKCLLESKMRDMEVKLLNLRAERDQAVELSKEKDKRIENLKEEVKELTVVYKAAKTEMHHSRHGQAMAAKANHFNAYQSPEKSTTVNLNSCQSQGKLTANLQSQAKPTTDLQSQAKAIMETIYQLHPEMSKHIDMISLIPFLNKYGILTQAERFYLSSETHSPPEKVTYLLQHLDCKGGITVKDFLKALHDANEHTGHIELCELLKEQGIEI